jgi:hypothetical protein
MFVSSAPAVALLFVQSGAWLVPLVQSGYSGSWGLKAAPFLPLRLPPIRLKVRGQPGVPIGTYHR